MLALSIFSSMLGVGIIAPLLPLYAEGLGATGLWLGLIFAGFSMSNAISTPVFGALSDRHGRKVFICIGLFFFAVVSLGFIWASTAWQLVVVRLVHGAVGGMVVPVAHSYVAEMSPEGEEGKWMGFANASFFTGFGIGPLIGGIVTEHFGMTVAFATMSGLNALAFVVALLFLPEVSRRKKSAGPRQALTKMATSKMVRGLFVFRLVFTLGRGSFGAFLPIYAAGVGITPSLIGILLAAHLLLMSLLGIPFGRLADRFSRKALLVTGCLVGLAYLALIPSASDFWMLLALSVIGSLSVSITMPAALALNVEEGRKYGMGTTVASFAMAFSLGMASGPIIAGAIADIIHLDAVFYFAAGMTLASAALFVLMTRPQPTVTR